MKTFKSVAELQLTIKSNPWNVNITPVNIPEMDAAALTQVASAFAFWETGSLK
jgi:hypothetical protein